MLAKIQLRRDTAEAWEVNNPVLASGEPGFEINTQKMKIGNGVTAWNSLPYVGGAFFIPMTSAQRDELVPSVGTAIYNTTTTTIQFYNGTSWVSL